ncbi:UNVERIFIED_CONTAM: hypothetical protein K2H54_054483 [Gekko kuhli]
MEADLVLAGHYGCGGTLAAVQGDGTAVGRGGHCRQITDVRCLGTFPGYAESAGQAAPGTKEKTHPKPPDFGGVIARATLVGLPEIFGLVGQLRDAHLGGREVAGKFQDVQAQFDLGGEGRLRPAQKFPDPNLGSPYTPHLEWFLPAQATMGDRRIYTFGQEECCGGIRSTFNWLLDALRDVLHRRQTEMHAPVSVERRVAVAVWWMANNMSYRAVAHQFALVWSTVAGIVVEDMSWSAIMSTAQGKAHHNA